MSGISLIVNTDGRPVPHAHLAAMVAAAPYRGVNGVGEWHGSSRVDTAGSPSENVALAFQALHVTPESALERQPLVDERQGLVLAADVRLDDREALRAALEALLVPVRGGAGDPRVEPTDADLVLAAYKRWGEACGAHLIGDFAFVLVDRRAGRVLVQRDPMGLRPLFWRWEGRRVLVASEVAQILAVPGVERRLFEPAIAAHLMGNFDSPDWTAYEGIRLLPAGMGLTFSLDQPSAEPVQRRFWDIDPGKRIREKDEDAYADRFRELFEVAVSSRLRTIRPVAIQLSGGMDSGAVAAMSGQLLREGRVAAPGICAYSWAFGDELQAADERHISDLIVDHYGLRASPVSADELWPLRDYPAHAPDVDGPFAGVYQVLLDHAALQAADEGMGSLMVGSRGDLMVGDVVRDLPGALLAGQWEAVRDDLALYRRWKGVGTARAVRTLLLKPPLDTVRLHALATPLRRAWRRLKPRTPGASSRVWSPWIDPGLLERTQDALSDLRGVEVPPGLHGVARNARYRLIFLPLQMQNMIWDERLNARAGLSLVDPWSDRRIAEFVLAVPQWVVQRLSEPKRLARLAMRGVMPDEALERVAKISPAPLYRRGLEDRARQTIEDLLGETELEAHGFIEGDSLLTHFRAVADGAAETPGLWWALTMEMWLRAHDPHRDAALAGPAQAV